MRKGNSSVKQLNRTSSHRKAMLRNMATSLFEHERIVTTRAKSKVLRSYAERLITRAKQNLAEDLGPERKLHNKREVMRHIADRNIVVKLFEEIAPTYKEREGGYIRLVHLPERQSDSSKMSIVELVDRKKKTRRKPKKGEAVTDVAVPDKKTQEPEAKKKTEKKEEKKDRKWFWGFRKKKREE